MCAYNSNRCPSVDEIFIHLSSDHPQGIIEAKIDGVAEAIANLTEKGVVDPVIKTTITLSESGFVSISDPIAVGEVKQDSIKGEG